MPLAGVAYGGGLYVACGDGGVITTSPDAVTWSARASGTTLALRSVAFGNGRFVAVGKDCISATSTDGVTWVLGDTGIASFASSVAFGDGGFVAVGSGGKVSRSSDGTNWTDAPSGATSAFLQTVGYGDGVFIAVGLSGLVVRSTDGGSSWQLANSGTTRHLQGIAYAGGTFVACGQSAAVLISSDLGQSWTRILHGLSANWLQSAVSGAGHFVFTGLAGTILSAPANDPASLTLRNSGLSAAADTALSGAGFGAGKFVAVGVEGGQARIVTSEAPVETLAFADWQARHFSAADLLDPLVSGPDANPDCDSLTNFQEYAFGRNPHLPAPPASSGMPQLEITTDLDQNRHLAIRFQRPVAVATLVSYALCRSTDLNSWSTPVAGEEILGDDGTTQTLRLVDPAILSDHPRAFLNLLLAPAAP